MAATRSRRKQGSLPGLRRGKLDRHDPGERAPAASLGGTHRAASRARRAIKHARFGGRLAILGFGSIGQGVLPLILRHIDIDPKRITIVNAEERGQELARALGVRFVRSPLAKSNYRDALGPELGPGDFLLNLSVGVSSIALIELCRECGALYLDTCIETWAEDDLATPASPATYSSYAFREAALALRGRHRDGPTAVLGHGANPGLVSHFVKRALLDIARELGRKIAAPAARQGWAELMESLGVKVVHVAERDTQVAAVAKRAGEIVNTWSIDGFLGEGCQPAELGWGSHERHLPADARRHDFGRGCAIYLDRPGAATRVRSWTPLQGPYHGFLISHGESISIADYFTLGESARPRFRPTVNYAYDPCRDAMLSLHEMEGKNWRRQPDRRLLMDEIVAGCDELGVLLMGHAKGAYWYGSRLSIEEARRLAPHNNATSLQVSCAALAGLVWAIENPRRGLVEPEEMDFERILGICGPYLGRVGGTYSSWTPLLDRGRLFPEEVDAADPWQFKNFRVA